VMCSNVPACRTTRANVFCTRCNFKKLQRVQNTLARVVLHAGTFEHITPALIQLHWLPVKQRALYKLALITFNVLQYNNPMYLRDLIF